MKEAQGKVYIHPATIAFLTDATWKFTHNVLWDNAPFSEADTAELKSHIRRYYEAIPAERFSTTASLNFYIYCERLLLASGYKRRYSGGFASVRNWYEGWRKKRLLLKRLSQAEGARNFLMHHYHTTF